jgi:aromatic-L-amino-acid/L-tryptophan decarboxylase
MSGGPQPESSIRGTEVAIEETLDPPDAAAWEAFAAEAHGMLDDALAYQRDLRSGPAWRPMPLEAKAALRRPLPRVGLGVDRTYREFLQWVLPYNYGNVHPRHWGWVNGQGTPLAVMAEMLAATMNPNCWGGEHAASYVEAQVLSWLREALGIPSGHGGILVSGGSMANVVGLAAAREARGGGAAAASGLRALAETPVLYASTETHISVDKAAGLLGLGFEAVRKIPVQEDFRVDVALLRERILQDRAEGLRPFCVVATAGTVNTGAIDPLDEIADLCEEHGLWLHVDGAFGALAALAPSLRPMLAGMERADSVAFDLHKWLYLPIEVACVMVRDAEAHRRTFSPEADYLQVFDRGLPAGEHFFNTLGPQLTRSFRALKVWMCMLAYGTNRYERLIEQNVRRAHALASRVREHPRLELLAPVPLNVVCFRYAEDGPRDLDALNRELLMRLWESGVAAPSSTVIHGRFALRCAFTNHRTRLEDLDGLVEAVDSLGAALVGEAGVRGGVPP